MHSELTPAYNYYSQTYYLFKKGNNSCLFYSKADTIRFDAGFALTCIHGKPPELMHLKWVYLMNICHL